MDLLGGIKAALRGRRQVDVASKMGVPQNTISRWNTGAVRPTLEQIAQLEEACGRPRGFILQAAGYLPADDRPSVQEAIAMDPDLDDNGRDIVTAAYLAAVQAGRRLAAKAAVRSSDDHS